MFCLYIDLLLIRLSQSGVGSHIGNHFLRSLAYADDITLLALTPSAIRKMLNVCDEFAIEFSITFNVNKTKCMIFRSMGKNCYNDNSSQCNPFFINNKPIEFVKKWPHLGNLLTV